MHIIIMLKKCVQGGGGGQICPEKAYMLNGRHLTHQFGLIILLVIFHVFSKKNSPKLMQRSEDVQFMTVRRDLNRITCGSATIIGGKKSILLIFFYFLKYFFRMPLDSGIMNICGSARYSTCNMPFGTDSAFSQGQALRTVGGKRKIIFFGHFSIFFQIFFFQG